ncbi:MAG TPA: hypothetical protein PK239_10995 [Chitinophagales bacterium]|nr:hypothetical protein [Chitinophagales bacterium]HRK27794.1 hypothetical protein [Chitinophagales bacterium]
MTNVLPNIDNNRVYGSDLQKLMKWYAILKTIELTFEPEDLPEETAPNAEESVDSAAAEVTQAQEEQTTEEQTEENPAN